MNLSTIFRYQFGQPAAIEQIAASKASFWTGMILVVLTAIPRNYDQNFVLESPFWLAGPLLFSFISGSFIFYFLSHLILPRVRDGSTQYKTGQQWQRFMGLFWMTAPVAWLYAIPVERFLSVYRAAQANLVLLLVVASWRVLLFSRVISVLQGLQYLRAVGLVLLPACIEILAIAFLGPLFSPAFGEGVLASMGGLRHSPEQTLLLNTAEVALFGAAALLVFVVLILAVTPFRESVRPLPAQRDDGLPPKGLIGLACVWAIIAVPAQIEQWRFLLHAGMVEEGRYRDSLDYLAKHELRDFPASRRLQPDPYSFVAFDRLPKLMAMLRAEDPEWVRRVYEKHMAVMLDHHWFRGGAETLAAMFAALERMPEAEEWIRLNRRKLPNLRMAIGVRRGDASDIQQIRAEEQLTNVLQRLGVNMNEWPK